MRHQDLTRNHRLESWVYANAAARTGASGFAPGDVGLVAYQQDNGSYWRLTATTPTWQMISGVAPAVYTSGNLMPTGVTGTTALMQGIAGSITPVLNGRIFVTASGSMASNTFGGGAVTQIRYGTGTAPVNGAARTGTAVGVSSNMFNNPANLWVPFCCVANITGLTVGTPYWLDLELFAQIAGALASLSVNLQAHEL